MLKPSKLANNNFLSSLDLSTKEVLHILELAKNFKNKKININLNSKVLGLIFDKSSTRTRVSFQVAMTRLGGTTIDLNPTTSQIGRGEPIKDTARVLRSSPSITSSLRIFCEIDSSRGKLFLNILSAVSCASSTRSLTSLSIA